MTKTEIVFEQGDYVYFTYEGFDIYGTIIGPAEDEGWFLVTCSEGHQWGVQPEELTLIRRPQSTDAGALEYEEIMSLPLQK